MIGTMKRRPRSLALVGALLLAVTILGLPAIAQERPLSAWRLNEWSAWESLPEVNPYATITGLGSGEGWGNSSASIGVTARAAFEPDLSRAELSAEFVPVSRGIITSDPRLFIAPLRQRLEWKVIVTVRNPNDVAMTNARVHNQFGKAFRATLTGQSVGSARIADADVKGLLPSSSGLTWDIGYLGPGAAARAELTVTTSQTGGRAEFAEEGVYSLDTGFQLTYRLLGKDEVRHIAPCSVIARVNPSALRPDGEPYAVQQKPIERDLPLPERPIPPRPIPGRPSTEQPVVTPRLGQQSPAVIMRVAPELSPEELELLKADGIEAKGIGREEFWKRFTVTATASGSNIAEEGGKFVVPAGESAEWTVDLAVWNPSWTAPWEKWSVSLEFGAELQVEVFGGIADSSIMITQDPGSGTSVVTWFSLHSLPARSSASASLLVKTKSPDHYGAPGELLFAGNMRLNYRFWVIIPFISPIPIDVCVGLDPICVVAKATPRASVSVSATRLDWRVRKPGTYAALAADMTATGYGKLAIQFSGFADLTRADGGDGAISAFYGFGDSLADVEQWTSAEKLNGQSRELSLSSSEPAVLRMWSKVLVGNEDPSAEYEDYQGGVITFIVSNN